MPNFWSSAPLNWREAAALEEERRKKESPWTKPPVVDTDYGAMVGGDVAARRHRRGGHGHGQQPPRNWRPTLPTGTPVRQGPAPPTSEFSISKGRPGVPVDQTPFGIVGEAYRQALVEPVAASAWAQRRGENSNPFAFDTVKRYRETVGPWAKMGTELLVDPANLAGPPGAVRTGTKLAKAGLAAAKPIARDILVGEAGAVGKRAASLPRDLVGAKPRYNIGQASYSPQFESDVDKALFIISQAKRSARDADYFAFVRSQFPDVPEATLRNGAIRQHIKDIVKGQPAGDVRIPDSGITQQLRPKPAAAAPEAAKARPPEAVPPSPAASAPVPRAEVPPTAVTPSPAAPPAAAAGKPPYHPWASGKGPFPAGPQARPVPAPPAAPPTASVTAPPKPPRGPTIPKGPFGPQGPFPSPSPLRPPAPTPGPKPVPRPESAADVLADLRARHPERLIPENKVGRVARALARALEGRNLTQEQLAEIETINEANRVRLSTEDVGENAVGTITARLRAIGPEVDVFGIKAGRMTKVTARPGAPTFNGMPSYAVRDVIENATKYDFADPRALPFIEEIRDIQRGVKALMQEFGVSVNEMKGLDDAWEYMTSQVLKGPKGQAARGGGPGRMAGKASFQKTRAFQYLQEEALQKGFEYKNPVDAVAGYVSSAYRLIGREQAMTIAKELGETRGDRMLRVAPNVLKKMQALTIEYKNANYVKNLLNRMARGEQPHQFSLDALKRAAPQIEAQLAAGKPARDLIPDAQAYLKTAQKAFQQFKGVYRKTRDQVARGHYGETEQLGRIWDQETWNAIQSKFGDKANPILEAASKVSRVGVSQVAAVDASWPAINGPLVFGLDVANALKGRPTAYFAKSVAHMFRSMADPVMHQKFMALPEVQAFLARHPHIMTGESEFFGATSMVGRGLGKIPVAGKPLSAAYRNVWGRAGEGFAAAGTRARIEMGMGMEETWLRQGMKIQEQDEFLNKITGAVSSKALGVGASQRAAESAAVFAPRFLRANLMLLRDMVTRNNMTAQQARKAMVGMLGGGLAAYMAVTYMMNQKPKVNPLPKRYGGDGSEFMSIRVGNRIIGVPMGFWYGMIKMAGTVAGAAANDPETLIQFNRAHPVLGAAFGKSSPLVSLSTEMATGRDFLGRELEGAEDYLALMAEHVVPIAAQDALFEGEPAEGGLMAEVLGMRSYSLGRRERLAQATFNMSYEDLEPWQKGRINRDAEAKERRLRPGEKELDTLYGQQLDDDRLRQDGQLTPEQWRERTYDRLAKMSAVSERNQGRPVAPRSEFDKARSGYYDISAGLPENPTPQQLAQVREEQDQYLKKLAPEMADQIERNRWVNMTPYAQEFRDAARELRPYWDIAEKMLRDAKMGDETAYDILERRQRFENLAQQGDDKAAVQVRIIDGVHGPQLAALQSSIKKLRQFYRIQHPDADKLLQQWYGYKPVEQPAMTVTRR